MRLEEFEPKGVIPACLLPFHPDLSIDEVSYRKHLRDVVDVEGISAITINAHASEVSSCSFEEQKRVLDITADEVGDRIPIVHGVFADNSMDAARIARMAEAGGAACLLVFPPSSFVLGAGRRPELTFAHFKTIAEATALPLICFQYPITSGLCYPLETLLELVDQVPAVRAIKDWCNDPQLHENHIRALQSLPRPVNVLTTHSAWLLSSLVLGCHGLLSGSGSVIADLHVALWRAVQADDLRLARDTHERIFPVAEVFYAEPLIDMHNRMKEALVILGRLPSATVRPPLVKLTQPEIDRIEWALKRAGIGSQGASNEGYSLEGR